VLAALAADARTETPLTIGLLGRPGAGKSSALRMLVTSITGVSGAARNPSALASAGKVHVVEIDASRLDGPPVVALADRVYASLAESCPGLLGEAIHASRDPRLAAREAFDTLDAARRKLSGERLALQNEEARRAGLAESVLFETAGTRIDAYARANRARLRSRLAGLGVEGEPIHAFKQLVHRVRDGGSAKAALVLRAIWSFKGQALLLVLAVLLLVADLGLSAAETERAAWLGWMRETESSRAAADWLEANIGFVATLHRVLRIGAGLALGANILRALRLVLPVFRASALLKEDIAQRRRHADVEFGHEVRRVESLAAEVDALATTAAEAAQRAAVAQPARSGRPACSPFLEDPRTQQAPRLIAAVGRLVAQAGRSGLDAKGNASGPPERIVIALDGLDYIAPSRACDVLSAAHGAFGPGFVMLIAADPVRLKAAAGEHGLDAWVQVPVQVGEWFLRSDLSALVHAMLVRKPAPVAREGMRAEPQVALDAPITEAEASLLVALAPLAGRSPRAVKRFINLYRLARTLCPDHKGMLALMLALDAGGTEAEIQAFDQALGAAQRRLELESIGAGAQLATALASVRSLMGDESLEGARRAAATARLFSFGRVSPPEREPL
jgi:hypothetical protein